MRDLTECYNLLLDILFFWGLQRHPGIIVAMLELLQILDERSLFDVGREHEVPELVRFEGRGPNGHFEALFMELGESSFAFIDDGVPLLFVDNELDSWGR